MAISIRMENLIKHIPQRSVYRASLTFRNLDLGKASTKPRRMNNSIWQSHGLELVNSNVSAKFHQNISYGSTNRASFIFFRIWTSTKPRPTTNGIRQSLRLSLVNIDVYSQYYPNIPFGSRVMGIGHFSLVHNLDPDKAATIGK